MASTKREKVRVENEEARGRQSHRAPGTGIYRVRVERCEASFQLFAFWEVEFEFCVVGGRGGPDDLSLNISVASETDADYLHRCSPGPTFP
jgi:hypothetical protein